MEINIDNKRKIKLSSGELNSFFRRNKSYILPISVIAVSFLLVVLVILPEFQNFLSARQQLDAENKKLSTLKNNYNFLTSLNDTNTSNDFKTLSYALPSQKDFTGIINALSAASSKTGAGIGDFSFSLGDLAKPSDQTVNPNPSIKLEVNLTGDANIITNFINELYKTAPVNEVVSLKISRFNSNLIMLFYYKPYPPQNVTDDAPVIQISAANLNLIRQIYSWNNVSDQGVFGIPISTSSGQASSSGGLNPSPF